MERYLFAVTYDVCEHDRLFEEMNTYPIDPAMDIANQVSQFAKKDVAPIVKVFQSMTSKCHGQKLYKTFHFKAYECGCKAGD